VPCVYLGACVSIPEDHSGAVSPDGEMPGLKSEDALYIADAHARFPMHTPRGFMEAALSIPTGVIQKPPSAATTGEAIATHNSLI
jgi:hypothetical protein